MDPPLDTAMEGVLYCLRDDIPARCITAINNAIATHIAAEFEGLLSNVGYGVKYAVNGLTHGQHGVVVDIEYFTNEDRVGQSRVVIDVSGMETADSEHDANDNWYRKYTLHIEQLTGGGPLFGDCYFCIVTCSDSVSAFREYANDIRDIVHHGRFDRSELRARPSL